MIRHEPAPLVPRINRSGRFKDEHQTLACYPDTHSKPAVKQHRFVNDGRSPIPMGATAEYTCVCGKRGTYAGIERHIAAENDREAVPTAPYETVDSNEFGGDTKANYFPHEPRRPAPTGEALPLERPSTPKPLPPPHQADVIERLHEEFDHLREEFDHLHGSVRQTLDRNGCDAPTSTNDIVAVLREVFAKSTKYARERDKAIRERDSHAEALRAAQVNYNEQRAISDGKQQQPSTAAVTLCTRCGIGRQICDLPEIGAWSCGHWIEKQPRSIAELFQDMLRSAFQAGAAATMAGESFETWYQREVLR